MKTLIILILAAALLAGASLSRPSENDFRAFHSAAGPVIPIQPARKTLRGYLDGQLSKSCTFKNDVVCTQVQKDGKTVYTGAFSHWWGGSIKPE